MRRIIIVAAALVTLLGSCGSSGSSGSSSTEPVSPATTLPVTTSSTSRIERVMLDDPVTGRTMTFAEFITVRGLTHVDTRYGDVWLDRIKGDPLFPDGIAYMVENCKSLDASDLERTEQIQVLTLACYEH